MSNLFYTYSSLSGTYQESQLAIQNKQAYTYSLVFDEKRGTIWTQDKEYGKGLPVVVSGQRPDPNYGYVISGISVNNDNENNVISYSYINVPSYTYISTNYETISYVRGAYSYIIGVIEDNEHVIAYALTELDGRVVNIENDYVTYVKFISYIDSLGYVNNSHLNNMLNDSNTSYINNISNAPNTGYVIGKIGRDGHNLTYAYVAVPTYEYLSNGYVNNVSLTKSGTGNVVKEVTISKTTTGGVNSYVLNVSYDNIASPGTLSTNNTSAQSVPTTPESLSGNIKLHKVSKTGNYLDLNNLPSVNGTQGNFAALDGSGNLVDSTYSWSTFLTEHQDISGKADKVDNATANNFAALDANGNLIDSTYSWSSFLSEHQDIPEYTIATTTTTDGFLKTYQLKKGDTFVGTKIDIPKDFLVKSGSVKTVVSADKASGGIFANDANYAVGDKYIDFVINTKESHDTDEHIYINVKDLVDTYTPGNGIDISDNVISANVATPITITNSKISHATSGPSTTQSTSKGDTTNQTPTWGGTFNALSATVDKYGHTTALAQHTVKIPNSYVTTTTGGLMSPADKTKIDNLDNVNVVMLGQKIASTTSAPSNLNAYTSPGTYYCPNNSTSLASSIGNSPVNNTGYKLIVLYGTSNDPTSIIQIAFTNDTNPMIFIRKSTSGGWSDWINIETSANKVTDLSNESTDAQYPSAKAVYSYLNTYLQPKGSYASLDATITGFSGNSISTGYEFTITHYGDENSYVATVPKATDTAYGVIKVGRTSTIAKSSVTASSTTKRYLVSMTSDGFAYVGVPWSNTDTKVTSAANHYAPSGGDLINNRGSYSSSEFAYAITEFTYSLDTKGHVTNITYSYNLFPTYTWLESNYQPVGDYATDGSTITGLENSTTNEGVKVQVNLYDGSYFTTIPKATDTAYGVVKAKYVSSTTAASNITTVDSTNRYGLVVSNDGVGYVAVPTATTSVLGLMQITENYHYDPSGDGTSTGSGNSNIEWGGGVVTGINIDSKGHIRSVTKGVIPANPNTDTKVTQKPSTGNTTYNILLKYSTGNTEETNFAYFSSSLKYNPSTKGLTNEGGSYLATTSGWVDIGTSSVASYLHAYGDATIEKTAYVKSGNVYIGSGTGSQCHQQYDATNKCLKFIFD